MVILDSEWIDECIEFTMMCFICVYHHMLDFKSASRSASI